MTFPCGEHTKWALAIHFKAIWSDFAKSSNHFCQTLLTSTLNLLNYLKVFVEELTRWRMNFIFPFSIGLKRDTTKGCVAEYFRHHSQREFSDICLSSWFHLLVNTHLSHLVWTLCDCVPLLLQKVSAYTLQIGNSKYQTENGVANANISRKTTHPLKRSVFVNTE